MNSNSFQPSSHSTQTSSQLSQSQLLHQNQLFQPQGNNHTISLPNSSLSNQHGSTSFSQQLYQPLQTHQLSFSNSLPNVQQHQQHQHQQQHQQHQQQHRQQHQQQHRQQHQQQHQQQQNQSHNLFFPLVPLNQPQNSSPHQQLLHQQHQQQPHQQQPHQQQQYQPQHQPQQHQPQHHQQQHQPQQHQLQQQQQQHQPQQQQQHQQHQQHQARFQQQQLQHAFSSPSVTSQTNLFPQQILTHQSLHLSNQLFPTNTLLISSNPSSSQPLFNSTQSTLSLSKPLSNQQPFHNSQTQPYPSLPQPHSLLPLGQQSLTTNNTANTSQNIVKPFNVQQLTTQPTFLPTPTPNSKFQHTHFLQQIQTPQLNSYTNPPSTGTSTSTLSMPARSSTASNSNVSQLYTNLLQVQSLPACPSHSTTTTTTTTDHYDSLAHEIVALYDDLGLSSDHPTPTMTSAESISSQHSTHSRSRKPKATRSQVQRGGAAPVLFKEKVHHLQTSLDHQQLLQQQRESVYPIQSDSFFTNGNHLLPTTNFRSSGSQISPHTVSANTHESSHSALSALGSPSSPHPQSTSSHCTKLPPLATKQRSGSTTRQQQRLQQTIVGLGSDHDSTSEVGSYRYSGNSIDINDIQHDEPKKLRSTRSKTRLGATMLFESSPSTTAVKATLPFDPTSISTRRSRASFHVVSSGNSNSPNHDYQATLHTNSIQPLEHPRTSDISSDSIQFQGAQSEMLRAQFLTPQQTHNSHQQLTTSQQSQQSQPSQPSRYTQQRVTTIPPIPAVTIHIQKLPAVHITPAGATYQTIGDYSLSLNIPTLEENFKLFKSAHANSIDGSDVIVEEEVDDSNLFRIQQLHSESFFDRQIALQNANFLAIDTSNTAEFNYKTYDTTNPGTQYPPMFSQPIQTYYYYYRYGVIKPRLFRFRTSLALSLYTFLAEFDDVAHRYYTRVHKYYAIVNDFAQWSQFWAEGVTKFQELNTIKERVDLVYGLICEELTAAMKLFSQQCERVGMSLYSIQLIDVCKQHIRMYANAGIITSSIHATPSSASSIQSYIPSAAEAAQFSPVTTPIANQDITTTISTFPPSPVLTAASTSEFYTLGVLFPNADLMREAFDFCENVGLLPLASLNHITIPPIILQTMDLGLEFDFGGENDNQFGNEKSNKSTTESIKDRFTISQKQLDHVKTTVLTGMLTRRFKLALNEFTKALSVIFRLLRMYYAKKYQSISSKSTSTTPPTDYNVDINQKLFPELLSNAMQLQEEQQQQYLHQSANNRNNLDHISSPK